MTAEQLTIDVRGVPGHVMGNAYTRIIMFDLRGVVPDPVDWVHRSRQEILDRAQTWGAVLLRALPTDVDAFSRVVAVLGGDTLEYVERSTPRSAVAGNVYTSTEYPADQSIPMHNENSYSDRWPEKLFFFCHTAPGGGGATPVADSAAVLRLLPTELKTRFADGVLYTRTLREGLGLSWQEAFQTDDRDTVERYCAEHGIAVEWFDEGLRTRQIRPSTNREPQTGAEVWFNQAHLFHVDNLPAEARETLLALFAEADLPRNAYHADGRPISSDDLAEIGRAYDVASYSFPWQQGDVLMIDNMRFAHGRQPFTGDRRILVSMT